AGLIAVARYANLKWANFAVAFLAVQCLLNALFDLKNLFVISTTTNVHNDAMNMAEITGLPAFAWIMIWIGISIVMISIGLRVYAVNQKGKQYDLPFED
ncbi:MAG TPA: M50 family metallopeptidase, partial [Pyrinomonadaceae bacterium]|nr:M50 family metallopeptidase [Pyrinomonadaceae bacterium]